MRHLLFLLCLAPLSLGFSSAAPAEGGATVFAAASLRGVLEEIFASQEPPVTVSYAGSGLIARQVAQGAPADAVFLANRDWLDWLQSRVPLRTEDTRDVIGNALVVIGQAGTPAFSTEAVRNLTAHLNGGRLAIGQHQSVPAGIYASDWLRNTGQWAALSEVLVETENVRLALTLVARGEARLGIVYASDAQTTDAVDVLYRIPPEEHSAIRYAFAALTPAGRALLPILTAAPAQAAFEAFGFSPLLQEAAND